MANPINIAFITQSKDIKFWNFDVGHFGGG